MSNQPIALKLAGYWVAKNDQGEYLYSSLHFREETAAELRRLHAVNQELLEALDEIAINTHDDTAERVARAAIAKAEGQV